MITSTCPERKLEPVKFKQGTSTRNVARVGQGLNNRHT